MSLICGALKWLRDFQTRQREELAALLSETHKMYLLFVRVIFVCFVYKILFIFILLLPPVITFVLRIYILKPKYVFCRFKLHKMNSDYKCTILIYKVNE